MKQLECQYTLPASHLPTLVRAVQNTLEDLAFTQVGRWVPHEVRLTLPLVLAQDPAGQAQRQHLGQWLSQQGWAWLMLANSSVQSDAQASLLVRCRPAGGV